jgi:hypothetical protein
MKTAREKFFERHGRHVVSESEEFLFEDGAIAESSMTMPVLMDPPDDPWQRATNILRYCDRVAELAQQQFKAFKDYCLEKGPYPYPTLTPEERRRATKLFLSRQGPRPDSVPQLTDEEKLERLETLRKQAQTLARYARRQREKTERLEPKKLKARHFVNGKDRTREKFRDRVESINV